MTTLLYIFLLIVIVRVAMISWAIGRYYLQELEFLMEDRWPSPFVRLCITIVGGVVLFFGTMIAFGLWVQSLSSNGY
jgi:hypothetical protein